MKISEVIQQFAEEISNTGDTEVVFRIDTRCAECQAENTYELESIERLRIRWYGSGNKLEATLK